MGSFEYGECCWQRTGMLANIGQKDHKETGIFRENFVLLLIK